MYISNLQITIVLLIYDSVDINNLLYFAFNSKISTHG